jgi:hypothetical protein
MDEDRKGPEHDSLEDHPIRYAPRNIQPPHLAARLVVDGIFAAGAALSFDAAFSFYVELVTRPGVPSSMMPLYGPAAGSVAFGVGLVLSLIKSRQERVWDSSLTLCLGVGAGATILGVFSGGLWR